MRRSFRRCGARTLTLEIVVRKVYADLFEYRRGKTCLHNMPRSCAKSHCPIALSSAVREKLGR